MKADCKKNSGFTLLELMIGACVLILGLVALISAYIGCFALNESARNLTIATNHAQCLMEKIRDYNIPSNITQEDWTTWAATDLPDGGGCNTLNNETINVTYPSGTGANPLEILVTVNWTEKNRSRSVQFSTLLTER